MGIYENIKEACKINRKSINQLEKELGFARSSISKFKNNSPSIEKVTLIANHLGVSIDSLIGKSGEPALTRKDERDITKILEQTKETLLSQEGLMFDGNPASEEAIQSILSAMEIGMEMAKKKNKELYTPNKYKKDWCYDNKASSWNACTST